jgi:hypothetical protein
MNLFLKLFLPVLLLISSNFSQDLGALLHNTDYDYAFNYSANHQIEMVDLDNDGTLDPIIINIYRMPSVPSYVAIYYKEGTIWDSIQPFTSSGSIGLNYCKNGALSGKFIAHCGNEISIIDPTNWQHNTYQSSLAFISSIAYLPDGTILAKTTSLTDLNIYKSTDLGVSFSPFKMIGSGDLNVENIAPLGVIYSSEDGQNISIISEATAFDPLDFPILYLYYSTDGGNSWAGKILGVTGSYGQVSNRNYAPLFTNFSQLSAAVDNNGVTHVVVNGYGEGVLSGTSDTTDVFPVLYWNSRDEVWIAITDEDFERPSDGFGNNLIDIRSGNAIGNSYPTISLKSDGDQIVVLWQSYEFSSGIGTPYNIYNGSDLIIYGDLYMNFSFDSGLNWVFEGINLSEANHNKQEQYPILAKNFNGGDFSFNFDFVYQYDSIPGVSIFAQNDASIEGGWYYRNFKYQFSNNDEDIYKAKDFNLSQNYPNPFNPSTKISYSIKEEGFVTLKVYDVLGKEVITLVNKEQAAGNYEVTFDASKLSSGVYLYTIKAGSFVQTRKMLLMK